MGDILENAAAEAAVEPRDEAVEPVEVPVAYIFDGWGLVPFEAQPRA